MDVQQAEALQPTVVVLDVSMPELGGIEATRKIAAVAPNAAVIALTRHTDDAYVHAMLAAGAFAYVLKQSASAELLQAVRAFRDGCRRFRDVPYATRVLPISRSTTGCDA